MMGRSGGITLLKVHTAHSLQVFYCKCVWKCDVCSEGVDPPPRHSLLLGPHHCAFVHWRGSCYDHWRIRRGRRGRREGGRERKGGGRIMYHTCSLETTELSP